MKKETKRQVGIRLSETDIEYLSNIKKEYNVGSMTKAFEIVLNEHRAKKLKQNENIANLVVEKLDDKYRNLFTRVRLASSTSDKNIQVILEILNSMLYEKYENTKFVPTDIIKSSLMDKAEEKISHRIAYYKQLKDNKLRSQEK